MTEQTLLRDLTVAEFKSLLKDTIIDDEDKKEVLLSEKELADLLKVHKQTVVRYAKDPAMSLRPIMVGCKRFYHQENVKEFMRSYRKNAKRNT